MAEIRQKVGINAPDDKAPPFPDDAPLGSWG